MHYALLCMDIPHPDVDTLFHSLIPPHLRDEVKVGMRAVAPFGKGDKPTLGYIIGLTDEPVNLKSGAAIKPLLRLCDAFPVLTGETLELSHWMQQKYFTPLASCVRCILPSGLPPPQFADPAGKARKPREYKRKESDPNNQKAADPPDLTAEQRQAVDSILRDLHFNRPFLLHGVTGSGKTEVYLRVIAHVLSLGHQAIVLVPEIALTPQTVGVFTGRFGKRVAVTHSRLTPRERYAQWKAALDGQVDIMIGPRSAVFTPFPSLGVIIVDEEHEHTYQSETSPKYTARDVALERGRSSGATVVFGSATPSLESYHRTTLDISDEGSFALLTLSERVNQMLPSVQIVDMRRELAEGNTLPFARVFLDALSKTFANGQQAMLFLNRRGHSPFVSCRRCGHVMRCENCSVSYTYHASPASLLCHYCGASAAIPPLCPACDSKFLRYYGIGTQKVEEEMASLFPAVRTLRMDMDTTRGKHGHENILEAFRQGEAQALIGTQMIAKGLDFPNVTLVGIISADISLFTGDFRAGEHTFQLLTQVSGRAGRSDKMGRVFIQTYNPEHYSITLARSADYLGFFRQEIAVRASMRYPPFTHIFAVMFAGPDERSVIAAINKLSAVMHYCNKKNQFEIIGPAPAFVARINKKYRWKLLIKGGYEEPLRNFALYCLKKMREQDPLPGITVHLTLDPLFIE